MPEVSPDPVRQSTPEPALAPPANIQVPALSRTESATPVPVAPITSTEASPKTPAAPRGGMTLSPQMQVEESPMGTPLPADFGTSPIMASNPEMAPHMDEVDAGYAFPPIPVAAPQAPVAPSLPIAEPAPPPAILSPTPVAQHMPAPQSQAPAVRTPSPSAAPNGYTHEAPREVVTPTPPSTSSLGQAPFTTPSQAPPSENIPSHTNGWAAVPGDPSTWTVDQVVAWAKGKGFDDAVQYKFFGEYRARIHTQSLTLPEEHEITGDVLLEMDANTLKEIDIIQFGKRVKIANAINELRRPGSMRSFGHGSTRSQQMSPAYNSHHRVPSITAAYPVSPNYGSEYQQAPPPQHSRTASMSGVVDTIPEDEAYHPHQRQTETAALGFNEVSA